ncbi:MAG: DUF1365 domain-containing protein [Acidobacteriota bacterium]|nr:DUF1365 domain-containing protein [Acidobacteriota bacterium]
MRSALYQGTLTHRRYATEATGHVAHDFRYRTVMPLLFLDELDDVVARHPGWSRSRPNVAWWRRRDYLGDPRVSLEHAVRDAVEERSGRRPTGPIALLGHVRTWGWLFNPLCVYYCFDESGDRVDQLLLEVRSTPWHERHLYVIDGSSGAQRFAKEMHVSPFLAMDHEYVVNWSAPGEHLSFHLGNRRGEERVFDASLSLRRHEITSAALGGFLWRRPWTTFAVSAGIYRQAAALWRKGAPFHSHPRHREDSAVPARDGAHPRD